MRFILSLNNDLQGMASNQNKQGYIQVNV